MNSTVKTLLIVGVVVGGGVAAYMYWKKKQASAAPVVAVTNGNPNQSNGSGLAGNITAAANAATQLGGLARSFGIGAA